MAQPRATSRHRSQAWAVRPTELAWCGQHPCLDADACPDECWPACVPCFWWPDWPGLSQQCIAAHIAGSIVCPRMWAQQSIPGAAGFAVAETSGTGGLASATGVPSSSAAAETPLTVSAESMPGVRINQPFAGSKTVKS